MATYNILSSCICRDAFAFYPETEYTIYRFLQSTSPLTWFEFNTPPQKPLTIDMFDDVTGLTNFQKKCVINDFNKTVLQQYEKKSDFFILDMISFANTAVATITQDDGTEHYFTYSKWFEIAYREGLKKFFPGKVTILNRLGLLKDEIRINQTIDKIIEWLVCEKGYAEESIILVKNKRVAWYSNGRYISKFGNTISRTQTNAKLDEIYDVFAKKLPKAHVIKMPFGVYSDTNHKWGLTDLHFCREFYDYLYECFGLISVGKQDQLYDLCDKYSELLLNKKEKYLYNCFEIADGKNLLRGNIQNIPINNYVAKKGATIYSIVNGKYQKVGTLSQYVPGKQYDRNYCEIGKNQYVDADDCFNGYCGDGVLFNDNWKTVNKPTVVLVNSDRILITHNGSDSRAQTNVIQTISDASELCGKVVTFSVYARVRKYNNLGNGGTIAIINQNNYNKGIFYAKQDFTNQKWERIVLTTMLPEKEKFLGLTVCLRALSGSEPQGDHAIVEFSSAKLEIGIFPTHI